jgi:hypothetical protein
MEISSILSSNPLTTNSCRKLILNICFFPYYLACDAFQLSPALDFPFCYQTSMKYQHNVIRPSQSGICLHGLEYEAYAEGETEMNCTGFESFLTYLKVVVF